MSSAVITELLDEGFRAHLSGDLISAKKFYKKAAARDGNSAQAWKFLGVLFCQQGDFVKGESHLRKSIELDESDPEAWTNLANALRVLNEFEESVQACQTALSLDPDSAITHTNLSAALRELHDYGGSISHAQTALILQPGHVEASINLGSTLLSIGLADAAAEVFGQAIQSSPAHNDAWSNWLFSLQYTDSIGEEEIAKAHRMYGSRFSQSRALTVPQSIKTIGFVGADFNRHPVSRFLLPLFESNRQHRYVCFHSGHKEDEITEKFRSLSDEFFQVSHLCDSRLIQLIESSQIDLLVDLSGHSAGNRLSVFAQRAAPIQATWLGYSASTGVREMDFFIGDDAALANANPEHYSERLVRLPGTAFSVKPSASKSGERLNRQFTFGSLNNPSKISESVLKTWAEILHAASDAHLIVKYPRFDSDLPAGRVIARLSDQGISQDRVTIVGLQSLEDHQRTISHIDLAFDSFPYNGATTTCDSLAEGTPVLTLGGTSYRSQMSRSILSVAGLDEWIVRTEEEFVDRAVKVARGEFKLPTKTELKEIVFNSPLLNSSSLAAGFQKVICAIESDFRSKISAKIPR